MSKLTNKAIFEALDAAANRTGIPAYAQGKPKRRHLRWLPIAAIGVATIGMVIMLGWTDFRALWLGNSVVMLGMVLAILLPMFGPVKLWASGERVDEFDREVRRNAFLATFACVSVVAVCGIWLTLGLALVDNWNRSVLLQILSAFSLYLVTLYSAVPTLHASWATRPISED